MRWTRRRFYVAFGSILVALLLASVVSVPQALAHGPEGESNDYHPGYGMGMGRGMMNNGQGQGRGMTLAPARTLALAGSARGAGVGRGHGMGWNGNFGQNNQERGQMPGYGNDYQQMPGYGNGFQQMPHAGRGFWQIPGSGMLNHWWSSPRPEAGQEADDSWWPW